MGLKILSGQALIPLFKALKEIFLFSLQMQLVSVYSSIYTYVYILNFMYIFLYINKVVIRMLGFYLAIFKRLSNGSENSTF